jgi:hypothetical protein
LNRVGYVIPKENEQFLQSREDYADESIEPLCNRESIHNNARLVIGCSIIHFEYKFIELLDEAYKSFLVGLHYSTVSLCSMTIERLCYDIIEDSKIIICNKELDYEQKKTSLISHSSRFWICSEISD